MFGIEPGAFGPDDWNAYTNHRIWKKRNVALKNRRQAAGLVSARKTHRPFNPAEDATKAFYKENPDHVPSYGVAIMPGGMALRKEQPKREGKSLGGGKRGQIMKFSADSRRRMMAKLMCFQWPKWCAKGKRSKAAHAFFITLTYSDSCLESLGHYDDALGLEYGISGQKVKRHIDVLGKRLKRLKGFSGMLWKMEIETRKSGLFKGLPVHIHFHCLILMNEPRQALTVRRWIASTWYQVAGSGDPLHRKAGTQTDTAYGADNGRLFNYLSKYLGKTFDGDPSYIGGVGRVWGIQGNMKLAQPIFVSMTKPAYLALTRRVRAWGKRSRYLSGFNDRWPGVRIFGPGSKISDLLRGLEWRTMTGSFCRFFDNFYDAFLTEKSRKMALLMSEY